MQFLLTLRILRGFYFLPVRVPRLCSFSSESNCTLQRWSLRWSCHTLEKLICRRGRSGPPTGPPVGPLSKEDWSCGSLQSSPAMPRAKMGAFRSSTRSVLLILLHCIWTTNAQSSNASMMAAPTTFSSNRIPNNSTLIANSTSPSSATSSVYPVWGPNESNNCKGSMLCGLPSLSSRDCLEAAALYDNNTIYYKYTALYSKDHSAIGGCTAYFKCNPSTEYGTGLTGAELKEA
jgi:hypothetical protein